MGASVSGGSLVVSSSLFQDDTRTWPLGKWRWSSPPPRREADAAEPGVRLQDS